MKIFYDGNGFIWCVVSKESDVTANGYTMALITPYHFEDSVVDPETYVPNYRYINSEVERITDPTVYQADEKVWLLYTLKLRKEVQDLLLRKTNAQMHELYDSCPDYMKRIIGEEISNSWWTKIHQTSINLSLEIFLHVLAEVQGIQLIEGRPLTTDEQTTFAMMLQAFRAHNAFMGFPLKPDAWYVSYIAHMVEKAELIRPEKIAQRIEIMGEIDGRDIYADAQP